MHNRALTVLAATLAALALGSAPALAGENDEDGDDDDGAPQVQNAPTPAAVQAPIAPMLAAAAIDKAIQPVFLVKNVLCCLMPNVQHHPARGEAMESEQQ